MSQLLVLWGNDVVMRMMMMIFIIIILERRKMNREQNTMNALSTEIEQQHFRTRSEVRCVSSCPPAGGANAPHHMLQMVGLFLCVCRPPEAKPQSLGKISVSGERPRPKQICYNLPSATSNLVSFLTVQTCESRSCGRTRSTSKTKEVRVCGGCAT